MKLYESLPALESGAFLLRPVEAGDAADLLEVYGDKNALPFFNSDNCDGDNFYYPTLERMAEAIRFWRTAYENRWFARWAVVDKAIGRAVGTVELCRRASEDAFDGAGVLRLDVRSAWERESVLSGLGALILPPAFALLECGTIITKAPIYAVERIRALEKLGFVRSGALLIGKDGSAYSGYWTIERKEHDVYSS